MLLCDNQSFNTIWSNEIDLKAQAISKDENKNTVQLVFILQNINSMNFSDFNERIYQTQFFSYQLETSPEMKNEILIMAKNFLVLYDELLDEDDINNLKDYKVHCDVYAALQWTLCAACWVIAAANWAIAWFFGLSIPAAIAATAQAGIATYMAVTTQIQSNDIGCVIDDWNELSKIPDYIYSTIYRDEIFYIIKWLMFDYTSIFFQKLIYNTKVIRSVVMKPRWNKTNKNFIYKNMTEYIKIINQNLSIQKIFSVINIMGKIVIIAGTLIDVYWFTVNIIFESK